MIEMLEHLRLMARYNAWQNGSLVAAANTLSDAERWQDWGGFFWLYCGHFQSFAVG